jgi:hypothetical protein
MSHKALKKFYDSRIIVIKMASHTSADLQPLDKTVFHPVKVGTRRALKRALLETGEPNMDAWDSPQHLEKVWYERATEKTICAGRQSFGIHPVNMNWVHEHASLFDTSISSMNTLDE